MDLHLLFTVYVVSVPLFIMADLLWLGVIAKSFYRNRLGHLLGEVNWFAATAFYFIFVLGLTLLATYPAASRGTLLTAVVLGGLYGFFTYATYDLTNNATMRDWPAVVTIVDIVWGTVLGAGVATGAVYLAAFLV